MGKLLLKRNVVLTIILSVVSLVACNRSESLSEDEGPIPNEISYNLHIRPILSDNCFICHGPDANKRQADLRLDIAEEAYSALKENPGVHAIVPGEPRKSAVIERIKSTDEEMMMPPPESNLKLTERQVKLIEKWISQGAKYEPHWAFVPPKRYNLPDVKDERWPLNGIDRFVLDAMERVKLKPNPEANREILLRRLSFDLRGLPPDLETIDHYLADQSKDAYDKLVDRFLSDSAYGERMASIWMDVARYADSHGYQDDYYRTQWPWRNWVIHAFNNNMPYDKFVTWQLAGDLLPDTDKEKILATAFNRNHKITEESGAIDEEYRVSYVVDRTNTFGKAFLGLTLECANCHDHKYDPISQKEYFQVYAFFNNVAEYGIEEDTPGFARKSPAKHPYIEITNEDLNGILSFIKKPDSVRHARTIIGRVERGRNYEFLLSEASKLKVSVMGDLDTLRKTYVLERGAYDAPGEEVVTGTPKSILEFPNGFENNRLGLARWLFDKRNPLTARVFVNRIWQEFFGVGLVATPGDFGMQGRLPTHPELLDWLAIEFMHSNWDIKRLIKTIVTSATYRQSSYIDQKKLTRDPENRLLARFPRYRLPADQIRDMVLATSGLLTRTIGGPSVKPYQPSGIWEAATSGRGNLTVYQQDTLDALYRRGLYTFVKRTVPPPSMLIFDASNRDECIVERVRTETPLQALVMMNDPLVLEASRVFAARLLKDPLQDVERIDKAFRTILGRRPDENELAVLTDYHQEQLQRLRSNPEEADQLLNVGEYVFPEPIAEVECAALMQVISTIYNLEEAIVKS
jgi:hypothetical protein